MTRRSRIVKVRTTRKGSSFYYYFINQLGQAGEMMFGANSKSRSSTLRYGRLHAEVFKSSCAGGFFMKYIFAVLLALCLVAPAREIRIQWPPNIDTNVSSYKLICGTTPATLTNVVQTTALTTVVSNLQTQTDYYFAIIAVFPFGEAQPSSLMAVLHYSFPPGFSMFSSQLWRTNIGQNFSFGLIYSNAPQGSVFYKYNPYTGYTINQFDSGQWSDPNQTFNLGEGAWFFNPAPTNFSAYFWGNITNTFTNPIMGRAYNLAGSGLPRTGLLQQDLGYVPEEGDVVYKWNGGFWDIHFYDFGSWNVEPLLQRSEGFFILKNNPTNWTVNQEP